MGRPQLGFRRLRVIVGRKSVSPSGPDHTPPLLLPQQKIVARQARCLRKVNPVNEFYKKDVRKKALPRPEGEKTFCLDIPFY